MSFAAKGIQAALGLDLQARAHSFCSVKGIFSSSFSPLAENAQLRIIFGTLRALEQGPLFRAVALGLPVADRDYAAAHRRRSSARTGRETVLWQKPAVPPKP